MKISLNLIDLIDLKYAHKRDIHPAETSMQSTDKDILTTAETAKLLGVSTRTAQLLIEGGTVPSWKTPGGHRRVYRRDIQALIDGNTDAQPPLSASVVVVAPTDRVSAYNALFVAAGITDVESFDDVHAALLAVSSIRPYAIVVDLADADEARAALLHSLIDNPTFALSRIIAVAPPAGLADGASKETPEQAVAAIRESFSDFGDMPVPDPDLPFPIAINESHRLVALERSGLVDTLPEDAFDQLTWLASQTLNAPVSLIALLTPTRQWFKSKVGLDLIETPRSWAFCNHTIAEKALFQVEDMSKDPRFADNPGVSGDLAFRFYAGAPIFDGEGFAVGSLCVIDNKPRKLDQKERQILLALAALASDEVRLRATDRQLRSALRRLARERTPNASHKVLQGQR